MADSSTSSAPPEQPPRQKRKPGPGRPFTKGQSGNPGGLPRGMHGRILKARRLALHYAPQAIETLATLMADPDSRVRVAAAEGLLDRAGLRPYSLEPERVQVTAAVVDVDALRAELARRLVSLAGPVVEAEAGALPGKPSALASNGGQIAADEPCR